MLDVSPLLPYKEIFTAGFTSPVLFQQFLESLDNQTRQQLLNFFDDLTDMATATGKQEEFKQAILQLADEHSRPSQTALVTDNLNKPDQLEHFLAMSITGKKCVIKHVNSLNKALLTASQLWKLFSKMPEPAIGADKKQDEDRKNVLKLEGQLNTQLEKTYQAINNATLKDKLQFYIDKIEEIPSALPAINRISQLQQWIAHLKEHIKIYRRKGLENSKRLLEQNTVIPPSRHKKSSFAKLIAWSPILRPKKKAVIRVSSLPEVNHSKINEVGNLQQLLEEIDNKLLTLTSNSATLSTSSQSIQVDIP